MCNNSNGALNSFLQWSKRSIMYSQTSISRTCIQYIEHFPYHLENHMHVYFLFLMESDVKWICLNLPPHTTRALLTDDELSRNTLEDSSGTMGVAAVAIVPACLVWQHQRRIHRCTAFAALTPPRCRTLRLPELARTGGLHPQRCATAHAHWVHSTRLGRRHFKLYCWQCFKMLWLMDWEIAVEVEAKWRRCQGWSCKCWCCPAPDFN